MYRVGLSLQGHGLLGTFQTSLDSRSKRAPIIDRPHPSILTARAMETRKGAIWHRYCSTLAAAVAAACLCLYAISDSAPRFSRASWQDAYSSFSFDLKSKFLSGQLERTCSSFDAYTYGRWLPIDHPVTSVVQLGLKEDESLDKLECMAVYDPASSESIDPKRLQRERSLRAASWRWAPQQCELGPPDGIQLLLYLLRMPHGMFLVGDSLTKQQRDALVLMLESYWHEEGPLLHASLPNATAAVVANAESHFLNVDHPVVARLEAYISFEELRIRIRSPIINLFWNSHIVDNPTLGSFVIQAGGSDAGGRAPSRYPQYRDDHWLRALGTTLEAYANAHAKGDLVDTLLVIGSGAHWSERCILGLHNPDADERSRQILKSYEQMVSGGTFPSPWREWTDRVIFGLPCRFSTSLRICKLYPKQHVCEPYIAPITGRQFLAQISKNLCNPTMRPTS